MADLEWELWNAGIITDDIAALAWAILAMCAEPSSTQQRQKKTYTAPTQIEIRLPRFGKALVSF
jgi:hypothetical protein